MKNSAALPTPLLLLAADCGDGYVPLGATMAKSGRKVATVFEDPRYQTPTTRDLFMLEVYVSRLGSVLREISARSGVRVIGYKQVGYKVSRV